jgi:large subunit ribosomal protein L6
MSRVAKKPIVIPVQVNVELLEKCVNIKGPLGQLSHPIPERVSIVIEAGLLKVMPLSEDREVRAQAGMVRANLANQVRGVLEGFSAALVLVKVGANAQVDGNYLVIKIGYSNPKRYLIREGICITTPSATEVLITGIDIQRVNQVAAEIIAIKPPEVYKGTGILRKGQKIKLKAAKKK